MGKNVFPNSGLEPARITLNKWFKAVGVELSPQDYQWLTNTKYKGLSLFGQDETGDWYLIIPPKTPNLPQAQQPVQQASSPDPQLLDALKRDPESAKAASILLAAVRNNPNFLTANEPIKMMASVGITPQQIERLKSLGVFHQNAGGMTIDKQKIIKLSQILNY